MLRFRRREIVRCGCLRCGLPCRQVEHRQCPCDGLFRRIPVVNPITESYCQMSGQPSIPCSGINDCLNDALKFRVPVKAVHGNVNQIMYEAGDRTTSFSTHLFSASLALRSSSISSSCQRFCRRSMSSRKSSSLSSTVSRLLATFLDPRYLVGERASGQRTFPADIERRRDSRFSQDQGRCYPKEEHLC